MITCCPYPFGFTIKSATIGLSRTLCFLYFYLKYLNIYASICFLTCNSLQRYFFLLRPFRTRGWNRYDLGITAAIWVMVGTACLLCPILRNVGLDKNTEPFEPWLADLGLQYINIASTIGMITSWTWRVCILCCNHYLLYRENRKTFTRIPSSPSKCQREKKACGWSWCVW